MRVGLDAVKLIDIRNYPDVNGNLAFVEGGKDLPFQIARAFYVYGVHPGDVRGQHAHRRCHQFLICVHGSVEVVCDDGASKKSFALDSPLKGLHIPPSIWAEQRYASSETMLMVLADRLFEEADYIREYAAFLIYRREDAR
jgi:UDP-2-acetamido-3-amino-2,3-dideoxy-glucuronate N-acetyltransferase